MSSTSVSNSIQEAVRLNNLLIDEETGEILSETDIGIDSLAHQLKDATEQRKAWEQAEQLLKLAIGKKLDDANTKAAETPWGVIGWVVQARPSAKFDRLEQVAGEFGLVEEEVSALMECGRDFDVKKLRELQKMLVGKPHSEMLVQAINALIEEKTVAYVQLRPLRKVAPRLDRVTMEEQQ